MNHRGVHRAAGAALTALVVLVLGGCAHAPKVERAAAIKPDDKDVVYYTLPKAVPIFKWTATKRTFTAGPFTAALEAWARTQQGACTGLRALDSSDPCYWRMESKRPNPKAALAACALSSLGEVKDAPKAAYLVAEAPIQTSVRTEADADERYAVRLSPSAFERLKSQITLSPQGALTEFSATSTNMAAEVAEAITSTALGGILKGGDIFAWSLPRTGRPTSVPASDLMDLVKELHRSEQARRQALQLPDAAAALAAISAHQAALRQLAEGVITERPVVVEKMEVLGVPERNAEGAFATSPRMTTHVDLTAQMACAYKEGEQSTTQPVVALHLSLVPEPSTFDAVHKAARAEAEAGLRYRMPVRALARAVVTCGNGMEGKCGDAMADAAEVTQVTCQKTGTSISVDGDLWIPQWGITLALPRRLGWGSGSISAKLDPQLGSLVSVATENTDSLGASVINNMYADATKDKETAALVTEQQRLDLQVKICASRAQLGMPLGPECPSPGGPAD